MALREMELKEVHRLITTPHWCPSQECVSSETLGLGASDAERKNVDQILGSSRPGTRALQVLSLNKSTKVNPVSFVTGVWNGRSPNAQRSGRGPGLRCHLCSD